MRRVWIGLHPAHSSIAICSISSRPKLLMHQAIPERSIICPISSSSGTRVASCSRESPAYLLVMEALTSVHLDGVVDVRLLVVACALLRGFLALGGDPPDHAVEARTERESDVLGEEDRHLLQLVLGQLIVLQGGVDLDLAQILQPERGDHRQRHHPLVAHRQSWPGPDGAEEVGDGQIEELVTFDVGHLPRIDLVHLGEALAAQFVHDHSFVVDAGCGTPSPSASLSSATSASGRSTSTASPKANASLRSFSPRPRVWVNASWSQ